MLFVTFQNFERQYQAFATPSTRQRSWEIPHRRRHKATVGHYVMILLSLESWYIPPRILIQNTGHQSYDAGRLLPPNCLLGTQTRSFLSCSPPMSPGLRASAPPPWSP